MLVTSTESRKINMEVFDSLLIPFLTVRETRYPSDHLSNPFILRMKNSDAQGD